MFAPKVSDKVTTLEGTEEQNMLVLRSSTLVIPVNRPSSDGMLPVNTFWFNSNASNLVSRPSSVGTVPDRLL